jgi:hypothetical protein
MALLAARQQAEALRKLDATVARSAVLFPQGDPWLAKVRAVLDRRRPIPPGGGTS